MKRHALAEEAQLMAAKEAPQSGDELAAEDSAEASAGSLPVQLPATGRGACIFEPLMAHQQPNGAQVGVYFEQVRGKAVP